MIGAETEARQAEFPVTWPNPAPKLYDHPRDQEDFLRRLKVSEAIKGDMRQRYVASTRRGAPRDFDTMVRQAHEFWPEYEEVNRVWVPEDPVYSVAKQGTALATANSTFEHAAASAGQLRILELFLGGEATASAVVRVGYNRVSSQGSGTAPTSYTPEKFNSRSPAAAGTYYGALTANVAWGTTQETLNANPMLVFAFNAFGGSDRWVSQPGAEIYSVNAEYMSLRSISGTSTISALAVVEEL